MEIKKAANLIKHFTCSSSSTSHTPAHLRTQQSHIFKYFCKIYNSFCARTPIVNFGLSFKCTNYEFLYFNYILHNANCHAHSMQHPLAHLQGLALTRPRLIKRKIMHPVGKVYYIRTTDRRYTTSTI